MYAPSLSAIASIFTIGHSTHDLEAFVSLLRGAGIEAVADVRRYPSSRRMPWFNSGVLADSLADAGIDYRHFEGLGGRRSGGLAGYRDHMAEADFAAAFGALVELAERRRTAVMCAERDWRGCHRRFIAEELADGGHEVVHIGGSGELEPHQPRLEV